MRARKVSMGLLLFGVLLAGSFSSTTAMGQDADNRSNLTINESLKLGASLIVAGRYDLAIAAFTHALSRDPSLWLAYSNRGLAYAKNEQYQPALADFTHALELDPGNAETYFKRGNAYFDKGDYREATEDYSRALSINPHLFRAYYNRCDAHERIGRNDLAIKDCRRATELEPGFQPARIALDWLTSPDPGPRPCFCNY